ncbi:conserved hypothetical protein [Leishmania braziliensis MHOM/BR/75/M2904]|uniref:Uncharacterized protein n=2 Tax=Leishmania braziliensis TaxID=5660 RepID=A4HEL4_LEIBR|nr:conserved hypothetical protein [Leishmania braziliensis MHOM/BR/75/M2904]CAJ2474474.1 unnamed protein product [Leishmania braziliensis]CAM39270.1 conserved hypothetical protein [Leishmania braziliensis MHOM/BR/75/M2904]SYZ66674.1 hypothetical_protein [Leishmania braziliensis MHOM/BR/75/M2904]
MIPNGEAKWSGTRPQHAAPSYQELMERIHFNRKLAHLSSSARRRVGAPIPSDSEVQAVYAARKAATAHQHEEMLQGDRNRRRVVSFRYYDALMAASTDNSFQEAQPLSDVGARRTVLRPLKKLVGILATRQRFSSLLRSASETREPLNTDQAFLKVAAESVPASPSPLPNISTLLRGITLPDVAAFRQLVSVAPADLPYGFVEAPRSCPLHEPFAFQLYRFTPVPMPEFVLDVAAQSSKEVRRGDGESLFAQQGDCVPTMMTVQPSSGVANDSRYTPCYTSARSVKGATLTRSPTDAAPTTG